MNRVAAVVVTYNRKDLLNRCLHCLAGQQGATLDIWVIDNASTDGTGEMVRGLGWNNLCYRNTGKNLGGAGGFEWGIREAAQAGYEYLWLMDDDTLPQPEALSALLEADSACDGQYGWLSSRALAPDGSDQPMNLQRQSPYREIDSFAVPLVPAVMASFVSLFLRTETVRRFGLPIGDFFIWSDDWEYTRRISRKLPCYAVTASRVVHAMKNSTVVNIATDDSSRWGRYRYFYRNDVVLYRREGPAGWLWLLFKDGWHSFQVLFGPGPRKLYRLGIIWKGFLSGICYHPPIPKL